MSDNYKGIVFTPPEVADAGEKAMQKAEQYKDTGVPLKVGGSDLGDYFAPLLPWEICAVQAQTHNGKTMFTDWWERMTVKHMQETGMDGDIVHVSLEESVEAMALTEYGRLLDVLPSRLARGEYKDIAKLRIAKTQIGDSRIWRIGESAERPDAELLDNPEERPADLTLSNIYRALWAMKIGAISSQTKIRLITIDYLQAIPIDPEVKKIAIDAQRRLQVREDVYRLRKMTVKLESPILVPVQAKQKLEGSNMPYMIPGMYDGEETASIAQRFDRIISLWMPKTSYPVGTQVTYNGEPVFKVEEDMVFLKVNKQRGGLPSGKTFELKVNYKTREYYSGYGKPYAEK
jgi:replicative DNA helicase